MTNTTTSKEKPTGDGNPTAGATNGWDSDTFQSHEVFEGLRAKLENYGFKLVRTERNDGIVLYFLSADNTSVGFESVVEIRQYLNQLEAESVGLDFNRLKRKFNSLGIALYRTDQRDGHVSYWVVAGLMLQRVHTLVDAEQCFEHHANRLRARPKGAEQ